MTELDGAYAETLEFMNDLMERYQPEVVAAVMSTIALSIYKTILPETDFNRLMDTIHESRESVKTFTRPVLQ